MGAGVYEDGEEDDEYLAYMAQHGGGGGGSGSGGGDGDGLGGCGRGSSGVGGCGQCSDDYEKTISRLCFDC